MAHSQPVRVRRTEFASSDPGELREVIDRGFGSRLQLAVPRSSDWRATVSQVDAGYFTTTDTRLPADLTFTNDGHDESFVIDTLLEGDVSIDHGGTVSRFGPGDTFLGTGPRRRCTVRSRDACIQAIALPQSLLTAAAAGAPDPPRQAWEFSSPEPASGGARRWRDTAQYVDRLLADTETAATPLLISSVARLLAATVLTVFPNTAITDPTSQDRHDARPDTVRRAVMFIDEHAHEDITIADIAAATFVTTRAIQLGFRRHLDTTPMAYLRRVRLDHAHHDLVAASPDSQTVTAIAYRWGFSNASRFATQYQEAYGVRPSHTLHQD